MMKELRMPTVGETLKGTYLLQSVLGEGGFAKAFAGTNMDANASIAVKVLKLTSVRDTIQFSKEAFRMAQLTHPNIVKVTDYDADEETLPYLVMPLAAYGSLSGEIKTRRGRDEHMPLERSLAAIEQIGEALGYLHQRRIVHQDVKPDNILLPNGNDFWLSDLGIARVLKPNDSLQPHHMGFSPQYVSPEQSQGRAVLASDQYSLGVTAYLLLTGRLPFIASSIPELLSMHWLEKPLSLADAVQALKHGERMITILRALDPIVQKALAKKPEDRYDTVVRFTKTLKETAEEAGQETQTGKTFPAADFSQQRTSQAETVPVIEDLIKRCVVLYEQEQYVELLQVSERIIALDPNIVDGWFYKGLSLCRFGKWEETLEPYERVIQLDPINTNAMRNKADSLNKLGRHAEALQLLHRALRIEPAYVTALFDKGIALDALGRHAEALEAYDQAISIDPIFTNAYNNKGNTLAKLGRHEEALRAYDQAISIDPIFTNAYNNKGILLAKLGRHEEALEAYDRAISIDPKDANVYFYKGNTLAKLGRHEEALRAYDQAIALGSNESSVYHIKGTYLDALERHEEALRAYDQAIALNPNESKAYYSKGATLLMLGRDEEAVAAFDQVIRIDPNNGKVYFNKGLALNALERHEEAIAAYDQAISIDPKDANVHLYKAFALNALERHEEAIAAYDQVIRIDPGLTMAYYNKGVLLCALGKYTQAAACFQQAQINDIEGLINSYKKLYHSS